MVGDMARSDTSPLRRTFPVPGGPPVRLRMAGPSDRAAGAARCSSAAACPPASSRRAAPARLRPGAAARAVRARAARRRRGRWPGVGAIDFGEDAPDVLVVDERFGPALGELLGRVLIGALAPLRAASPAQPLASRAMQTRGPLPRDRRAAGRGRGRDAPRPCAAAAARAEAAQPLWAAVPARPRGRATCGAPRGWCSTSSTTLALLLARETGRPRTEAVLGELLPAVAGLERPRRRRPGRARRPPARAARALLRGGRRAVGRAAAARRGRGARRARLAVDGARAGGRPPRCWPATASLLAPAAPLAGERLRRTFLRAGIPEELLAVVHGEAARGGAARRVRPRRLARRRRTPRGRCSCSRARRSSRSPRPRCGPRSPPAGATRRPRAGSSACPRVAEPLLGVLRERAVRLRGRRPRERGGGGRPAALGRGPRRGRGARRRGGRRRRGADLRRRRRAWRASPAPSTRPPCCAACPPARGSCASPCPGPVLAVVEAPGEAAAIALVRQGPTGERPRRPPRPRRRREHLGRATAPRASGSRARSCAELTWVNEHGAVAPGPALRLQRHVAPRQVASRPALIGGARRLPYDPALVRARTAATRLAHGRESDRLRGAPARRRAAGAGGAARRVRAVAPALERQACREGERAAPPAPPSSSRSYSAEPEQLQTRRRGWLPRTSTQPQFAGASEPLRGQPRERGVRRGRPRRPTRRAAPSAARA